MIGLNDRLRLNTGRIELKRVKLTSRQSTKSQRYTLNYAYRFLAGFPGPKIRSELSNRLNCFKSLRVTDPAIDDMWLAQGYALRTWHEERAHSDIAIVLNTGAGKNAGWAFSCPIAG
jgi:hypothetical protein